MASNRELAEEASALGKELGVEASCDGLNNAARVELVAKLQAELAAKRAGESVPPVEPPAEETLSCDATNGLDVDVVRAWSERKPPHQKPPAVDGAAPVALGGMPPEQKRVEPAGLYPYTVAPGKTVLLPSRKIIGPGKEIRWRDLVHTSAERELGEATLAHFVARGVVIKAP